MWSALSSWSGPMSFAEAVTAMRLGFKVKRLNGPVIELEDGIPHFMERSGFDSTPAKLSDADILAHDWFLH